ncbi:hypothetical protein Nepgr_018455 [Nepenthes gracilis]|uniref:DUF7887 domain-containing protein n=1 Tax=Nepenthes gracilis TaxID=150966 RepID=A0AAD3STG4_NEPGR|nr:hypothetical protein Nepgr_018455 [Nepenthes gracilis]
MNGLKLQRQSQPPVSKKDMIIMLPVTGNSFISDQFHRFSHHFLSQNGKKFTAITAQKRDSSKKSRIQKNSTFSVNVSSKLLAQSAIAVFGLGFVDAGYSGDWSRIGVISSASEEMLKIAAFAVVPVCLFLIFALSKEPDA